MMCVCCITYILWKSIYFCDYVNKNTNRLYNQENKQMLLKKNYICIQIQQIEICKN